MKLLLFPILLLASTPSLSGAAAPQLNCALMKSGEIVKSATVDLGNEETHLALESFEGKTCQGDAIYFMDIDFHELKPGIKSVEIVSANGKSTQTNTDIIEEKPIYLSLKSEDDLICSCLIPPKQ